MNHFADIVGQDQIRDHLQDALLTGRVSHAYILDGPKESGRHFIAEIFAAALQCTDRQTDAAGRPEACGQCISCIQAEAKSQPDIIYVHRQMKNGRLPNVLSVDEIRAMRQDVAVRPYASDRKVYIIEEAELMNPQAQNALLKTIEEPPAYAVILLLADGTGNFLPTIMSRCITLRMKEVPAETIAAHLENRLGIPHERALMCANFAGGNLGRAIRLAGEEGFDEEIKRTAALLGNIGNMSYAELSKLAADAAPKKKKKGKDQEAAEEESTDNRNLTDYILLWFRDVLNAKIGGRIIFEGSGAVIREEAARISYEGIEHILTAIEEFQKDKSAVSAETALTLLLVRIRDEVGRTE